MKTKQRKDGHEAAAASRRRSRNQQRLGGRGLGLSIASFANAKSNSTGYNPALIKKQREFYKNVKIVKKYKKFLKQQSDYKEQIPAASILKDGSVDKKKAKRKKNNGSLQNAREEYERMQEEKEKVRKEREAIIQAKNEERARAEARRKATREKLFKRTQSGQPVMKYRIEHLLEGIIHSSSN